MEYLFYGLVGLDGGGSQLAIGSAVDAIAVSAIFMNTFLAGVSDGAAIITITFGKTDVVQMLMDVLVD